MQIFVGDASSVRWTAEMWRLLLIKAAQQLPCLCLIAVIREQKL